MPASHVSGKAYGTWAILPATRTELAAVVRCIAPHAFADPARGDRLLELVVARIGRLAPRSRRELLLGLRLFASPWVALATGRAPRAFAALTPARQAARFDGWLASSLPLCRTIAQSLRRVVLLVEYGTPEAQADVGDRGPLFSRRPAVAWEGALPGTPSDDDPVARVADPATAPMPAPTRSPLREHAPPRDHHLNVEVVVIGTGAGGAVAACRLAEAGHDVLILESGELVADADFDEHEATLAERLYAEGGARATDDQSVGILQGAVVGGGTTVNWMVMLRTPEHVTAEWAARHGAVGMGAADLAPVFDRVEREVHARLVTDDAHNPANRALLRGAAALGWRAASAMINAKGCVRAGFCGYGCRYDAKQGTLITYLPRAIVAGARLITRTHAERIELRERGTAFPRKRVTATVRDADGSSRTITIDAPVVIVAGGAIETPALLQRSLMGGDAVGRYLRLHPTSAVIGQYADEMYLAGGIPLSTVCDHHLDLDGNGYGFWIEVPHFHPAMAAVAAPGFGAAHRDVMLGYRTMGAFITLVRDGADQDHSSGDVRVRRDGSLSIRYRLAERDQAHLRSAIVAGARMHLAAGAQLVRTLHHTPGVARTDRDVSAFASLPAGPNQLAVFSAHVNGTCRLGTDPRTSGTDPHGERWGAPGVFVADGSWLPTALGVNPQETIMALATIVADRIAARRRPG
jgi:choline dehydrogenase-like flavoprotein